MFNNYTMFFRLYCLRLKIAQVIQVSTDFAQTFCRMRLFAYLSRRSPVIVLLLSYRCLGVRRRCCMRVCTVVEPATKRPWLPTVTKARRTDVRLLRQGGLLHAH